MIIRIEEQQAGPRWVVYLDTCRVGFRRLDEAQAFTRTLQARIEAPHTWPRGNKFHRLGTADIARVTRQPMPDQVAP